MWSWVHEHNMCMIMSAWVHECMSKCAWANVHECMFACVHEHNMCMGAWAWVHEHMCMSAWACVYEWIWKRLHYSFTSLQPDLLTGYWSAGGLKDRHYRQSLHCALYENHLLYMYTIIWNSLEYVNKYTETEMEMEKQFRMEKIICILI